MSAIIIERFNVLRRLQAANQRFDLALNEFLAKEVQFYEGLDYLRLLARLGRKASMQERLAVRELLPCGVTVITDAASMHAHPRSLHGVTLRPFPSLC